MIEQINIENYKSIRQGKITLTNLNVLIGANGAGKSNFISLFELLQAVLNQRLGSHVLSHGGIDNLLYRGQKQSKFIRMLIDFDNTNAFFCELRPTTSNKAFIELSGDYVNVGVKVKVKEMNSGEDQEFIIVGSTEADPFASPAKISNESLVGQGLLGKKIGEVVEILVPDGMLHYKIEEISR